jgi:release factor glutamine methyltransferase
MMNQLAKNAQHGKVFQMLQTPGLEDSAEEDLKRGKCALSEAKAHRAGGRLLDAQRAYSGACDAFERVRSSRPELGLGLEMRLVRFRDRYAGLDTLLPSKQATTTGPSVSDVPKLSAAGARTLKEKPREMWSSRVLLKYNADATESYFVEYSNLRFIVNPAVFSPAVFPDTFFFAAKLPIRAGERFLEIGSGSGMISALAALQGASLVVATDINPAAVKNTADNFVAHSITDVAAVRLGDVFLPLKKGEVFDTIWWNVPFMHCDKEDLSMLEKALYDPEYRALERYLGGAKKYLGDGGHVLIGFSNTHGHVEVLEALAVKYGWKLHILAEQEVILPASVQGAERFAIQLYEAVPYIAPGEGPAKRVALIEKTRQERPSGPVGAKLF